LKEIAIMGCERCRRLEAEVRALRQHLEDMGVDVGPHDERSRFAWDNPSTPSDASGVTRPRHGGDEAEAHDQRDRGRGRKPERPFQTPSEIVYNRERARYSRLTEGVRTYGSDLADYARSRGIHGSDPLDTAMLAVSRYRSHVSRLSR
jgi:hypothetical protein